MDRKVSPSVDADRLSQALAQITKTPALTAGILRDAIEVIAREGPGAGHHAGRRLAGEP